MEFFKSRLDYQDQSGGRLPRFGGFIRMSLRVGEVKKHAALLKELIVKAYEYNGGS